jgi:hypothetical protein
MSDDEKTGDEDFKKYLENNNNNLELPAFLIAVNHKKTTKAINLFRETSLRYSELPMEDPMRAKMLVFMDKVMESCLAGLRFYDFVIFKESDDGE